MSSFPVERSAVIPITFTFVPEGASTRVAWTMTGDKMAGLNLGKGLAPLARAVPGKA